MTEHGNSGPTGSDGERTDDRGSDAHEFEVDWTGPNAVSTAVVTAVARIEGVDQSELEPLSSVVDPDSLDRVFRPRADGPSRSGGHVSFRYEGHRVTVRADGQVVVEPLADPDANQDATADLDRSPEADPDPGPNG